MTGYDVLYWLSELWYDLTHLDTASLPEVVFKLVVIFFVFIIGKQILSVLWRVFYHETLRHIIEPIFKVVFFPFRIPKILMKRAKKKRDQAQREREGQIFQQKMAAQEKREQEEALAWQRQREQDEVAEAIRLQNQSRIR